MPFTCTGCGTTHFPFDNNMTLEWRYCPLCGTKRVWYCDCRVESIIGIETIRSMDGEAHEPRCLIIKEEVHDGYRHGTPKYTLTEKGEVEMQRRNEDG